MARGNYCCTDLSVDEALEALFWPGRGRNRSPSDFVLRAPGLSVPGLPCATASTRPPARGSPRPRASAPAGPACLRPGRPFLRSPPARTSGRGNSSPRSDYYIRIKVDDELVADLDRGRTLGPQTLRGESIVQFAVGSVKLSLEVMRRFFFAGLEVSSFTMR